jgi:hypothetical protein
VVRRQKLPTKKVEFTTSLQNDNGKLRRLAAILQDTPFLNKI